MKRLKAYYAWPRDMRPVDGVDVIFARDAREARKIAYKRGEVINYYSVPYIEIKIRRYPEADWWAEFVGRPCYAEDILGDDPCFKRDAYGHIEGLDSCGSCGKPDTSSLHPDPEAKKILHERWKICPDCGNCNECGCIKEEKDGKDNNLS